MYVPPAFKEDDLEFLRDFVQANPLGLLISNNAPGIVANLVPFEHQFSGDGKGTLTAHLARANQQLNGIDGQEVLVVFQGSNAYITPQWYQSKREHGKVVPTWNYELVQVRGTLRVIDDAAWLLKLVTRLTDHHEQTVAGQPWHVRDAPDDFIAAQLKGIAGIEIAISEITGKVKASQNRPMADRAGVVRGLEVSSHEQAQRMAEVVRKRGGVAGELTK